MSSHEPKRTPVTPQVATRGVMTSVQGGKTSVTPMRTALNGTPAVNTARNGKGGPETTKTPVRTNSNAMPSNSRNTGSGTSSPMLPTSRGNADMKGVD